MSLLYLKKKQKTNTIFIKIDFFDVFMHFELRWYTDGASNLLIEVWDSSACDLTQVPVDQS